jgi:hypothetical protein
MKVIGTFFIFLLYTSFLFGSRSAKAASKDGDVFSESSPVNFQLSAPFKELFNYRVPANSLKNYSLPEHFVEGTLTYMNSGGSSVQVPVRISLRGNTSQSAGECPFPKLKLKFDLAQIQGTIFENHKVLGVGTHCGLGGGSSALLGRIWNGLEPHREELAYEVLKALNMPSYQARRAFGTYQDTSGEIMASNAEAFFLEDMGELMKRVAAVREIRGVETGIPMRNPKLNKPNQNQYLFQSIEQSPGNPTLLAIQIFLFENMIGNFDYHLKLTATEQSYHDLWNVKIAELPNGNWIAIPYDFDLSSVVTGRNYPFSLSSTRNRATADTYKQAAETFERARSQIYQLLPALNGDPEGQKIWKDHLDRFYKELSQRN